MAEVHPAQLNTEHRRLGQCFWSNDEKKLPGIINAPLQNNR